MNDDHYRKGAEAMAKDFPHNRSVRRAMEQMVKCGFGLLPGEAEFMDGYRDTYRAMSTDAQRTVSVQPASLTPSPSGASVMSNSTYSSQGGNVSYAVQIGLLEQLKTYLERFDTGLSNVDFKYRSQMDALDGLMLAEDWHLLNENHCAPTCAAIRRVQAFIMQESVPVLSNQIAYFSGKATSGAVDQLAAVESDLAHGAPSGDHRSWHGQIELLREFKGFLGRLEVSLSLFQINYRQQVAGLETMMMTNAHAEFAEHQLDPTLALIQRLREFIAEDSVPTVNRIIADIEGRPSL